jgi:hypothetical protein
MAGSVPRVALVIEPVIGLRPVRVLPDRLTLVVRARKRGVDLGVGHRLALDPDLVALPSLGLGHHLGDQIPTQPHLPRLAPMGASATRWPSWRLVHERLAHPLAHRQPVLPRGNSTAPTGANERIGGVSCKSAGEAVGITARQLVEAIQRGGWWPIYRWWRPACRPQPACRPRPACRIGRRRPGPPWLSHPSGGVGQADLALR